MKPKIFYYKWTKEQEALLAEWAKENLVVVGYTGELKRNIDVLTMASVIVMSTLTGTANFAMVLLFQRINKWLKRGRC